MNFEGLIIGLCTFLIIGIFHPLVIKGEYYFGKAIWIWFLILGIIFVALSLFAKSTIISSILGVTAFCFFWSIRELYEQEERVLKGWYPKNPNRDYSKLERKFEKKHK
ncbi:MAG: DUF4491 family protein [Tissierellia bacterium]|nr:DUF4491 family protein [Tissierellia bacterium]